jgi:hypothetical protein
MTVHVGHKSQIDISLKIENNYAVFGSQKKKDERRFYLLPGMGGRALKRKRRLILQWSIVAGLFASAVVAGILYLISSRH